MKKILLLYITLITSFSFINAQQAGTLDATFQTKFDDVSTLANNIPRINSVAQKGDGKMFVSGDFISYNGTSRYLLALLNADGSLDNTFVPILKDDYANDANQEITKIIVQADGKIVCAGKFSFTNSTRCENMMRINADGSYDATFVCKTNGSVSDFILESDGKITLIGNFTTINGSTSRPKIARITSDGSVDATFYPGGGFADPFVPYTIAKRANGKYFVGGYFTSYNGFTCKNFVCIEANGSADINYSNPVFNNPVLHINLLSNEDILVAGYFSNVNSISKPSLAKIKADQSLDLGFNINMVANAYPTCTKSLVLPTGKIIIVGRFIKIDGIDRRDIARLNEDGSLDTTFKVGTGIKLNHVILDIAIKDLLLQADGKVVIAGFFNQYNDVAKKQIIRLHSEATTSVKPIFKNDIKIYPNPINGRMLNLSINENAQYVIMDNLGKIVMKGEVNNGKNTIELNYNLTPGLYTIQINNISHKIIIN